MAIRERSSRQDNIQGHKQLNMFQSYIFFSGRIPSAPGPRVGTQHPLLSPPPPVIMPVSSSIAVARSVQFAGVVVFADLPLMLLGCLITFPDPAEVG